MCITKNLAAESICTSFHRNLKVHITNKNKSELAWHGTFYWCKNKKNDWYFTGVETTPSRKNRSLREAMFQNKNFVFVIDCGLSRKK